MNLDEATDLAKSKAKENGISKLVFKSTISGSYGVCDTLPCFGESITRHYPDGTCANEIDGTVSEGMPY